MVMDTKFALDFLQKHQPMPDDEDLSEELIATYNEIREYFMRVKDKKCIKLFLNSFGYLDGFGVYQLVDSVILQFSIEDVLDDLIDGLKSEYFGVRYWCAMISANYPCLELVYSLEKLLYENNLSPEDEFDLKSAALISLSMFEFPETIKVLKSYINKESDEELLSEAKTFLSELEKML